MGLLICNGWTIYYHPLFMKDYIKLETKVSKLKASLPKKKFSHHETVKLYASIVKAIETKIPKDPFSPHFRLEYELEDYCRVKGMGIPESY